MNIRNFLSFGLCLLSLLPACGGESQIVPTPPTVDEPIDTSIPAYYISSSLGSDSNPGTSPDAPWKTLERINRQTFEPGDRILLRAGDTWDTWNGSTQSTTRISSKFTGTAERPIVISSYGSGDRPRLTASAPAGHSILTITNADWLRIENLEVGSGPGYGIVMSIDDGREHGDIVMKNIHAHDMPHVGIFFNSHLNRNVEIVDCTAKATMLLFAVSGGTNINLTDCTAEYCSYGGYSIIGVEGGTMRNCNSFYGCTVDHPEGACGIFLGNIDGYEVVGCEVAYQKRLNDNPDAEAIDFERNCHNVTVRDCYFHDNDGSAMMFFANGAVNSRCVIEGCRIENNHRNASNPRGFEIYFTELGNNDNGVIRNNTFVLPEGVGFISTADSSVIVEGNTLADGTPLEICPAWSGVPAVLNGDFESPALGYGKYEYRPIGGKWTFRGNAGITGNGSDFNPPPATQGAQVLFLQGGSDVTQRIALEAGTYKLTCCGACRSGSEGRQGIEIYVDGKQVGDTVYPADATAYADFESVPFTVEKAGDCLLEIRAVTNQDVTAFIDNVALVPVR